MTVKISALLLQTSAPIDSAAYGMFIPREKKDMFSRF